jgi:beta-hydroxylase
MSAASSPNDKQDETGMINKIAHIHWLIEQRRKQFKAWNRSVYKFTKWTLITLIIAGFVAI